MTDWVEATDPGSGRTYYYNSVTGASQWDRPAELDAAANADGAAAADAGADAGAEAAGDAGEVAQERQVQQAVTEDEASAHTEPSANTEESAAAGDDAANLSFESLPGGWIEATDPNSGKTYYYNQGTGESSWDRPVVEVAADGAVDGSMMDEVQEDELGADEPSEEMAEVQLDEPAEEEADAQDVPQDASYDHKDESFASGAQEGEGEVVAEPRPLPAGWVEAVDPGSGNTYYYNTETGESSWDRPAVAVDESYEDPPTDEPAVDEPAAEPIPREEAEESFEEFHSPEPVEKPSAVLNGVAPLTSLDAPPTLSSLDAPPMVGVDHNAPTKDGPPIVNVDHNALGSQFHSPAGGGRFHSPLANGGIGEPPKQFQLDAELVAAQEEVHAPTQEEEAEEEEAEVEEEQEELEEEDLNEPVTDELPPGWVEATDPASGKIYYYNAVSGEAVWDRPVADEPIKEEVAEPAAEEVVSGEDVPAEEEETVPSESEPNTTVGTAANHPEEGNEPAAAPASGQISLESEPYEVVESVDEPSPENNVDATASTGEKSEERELTPTAKHELDKKLMEPYHYINSVPGKDVRGKLIDCFQLWFNVPRPEVLTEIKSIVADLHNASLLVDDIEDNSRLRRGVPVAHSIFGVAPVINTANYVYFMALERCFGLGNDDAMKVFVSEMLNLHRGQGHDILWRDTATCPTEEQYISMVTDKTGGLFRLAVGLLQSFATTRRDVDFVPLVNNLGLYFQVRDDLINLADEEYFKSKSFCEDLTEGKFSFPIIHCIRSGGEGSSEAARLLSILKQRTEDADVKRYAQRLMFDAGSLRYTREKCHELKREIVKQIEELGGNEPLLKVIETLDVQVEKMAELDNCGSFRRAET